MQIKREKEGYADIPVSPKLDSFLDTLFMKMPSLTFSAHDYTQKLVGSAKYDDQANIIEDSEWVKLIVSVRVYNGIEEVGFVRVDDEVYRSNTRETLYQIRSDNNRLNNGRNDTKKTKDPKEALKRCLKVFVTSPESKMVHKRYEHMASETNNMKYWSARTLSRIIDDEGLNIIEYFRLVKEGELNATIPPKVHKALSDSKVLAEIDTAKLAITVADALERKEGLIVGEVNGKIAVADLTNNTYRTIDSSYDLPEVYQAKYAMLKIVDERQPVAQVGVKTNDRNDDSVWYFLMSGDILTTC
jgi:hypothetical protein